MQIEGKKERDFSILFLSLSLSAWRVCLVSPTAGLDWIGSWNEPDHTRTPSQRWPIISTKKDRTPIYAPFSRVLAVLPFTTCHQSYQLT